jgi:hypothetical protein
MTLPPHYLHGERRESVFAVTPPKIYFRLSTALDTKAQGLSRLVLQDSRWLVSQSQPLRPRCRPQPSTLWSSTKAEVKPNDKSFKAGIQFTKNGNFNDFFSIGGAQHRYG